MGECQLNTHLSKQQKPARDLHQNSEVLCVGEDNDPLMLSAYTAIADIPRRGEHPVSHGTWSFQISSCTISEQQENTVSRAYRFLYL